MYKVGLDFGHGITTAGKRSFDGTLREYEFNRNVGHRIKKYLESTGKFTVVLTCTSDADKTLEERCTILNKANVDIVVSIHANAWGTTFNSASGWEIYAYKTGSKGEQLAKAIMSASIPYLGIKNRGLKTANFYILKRTKAPAVLIEHGFYTNKTECELLKSDAFREKCAIADTKGILNYFRVSAEIPPKEKPSTPNPTPKTIAIDYEKEVIRIFVDGIKAIALTGYTKCVNHAKQNYKGKHVVLECAKDGKKWDLGILPMPKVEQPKPTPIPQPKPVEPPKPIEKTEDELIDEFTKKNTNIIVQLIKDFIQLIKNIIKK